MNSLGIACKQYIEAPRQQLRISIALARNPEFENDEQQNALRYNIRECQLDLIQRCRDLYKFIDYLDDARKVVPLEDISK